ncbi:cytochrome c biogenesis protein CcsA, partial [Flavobacteriales bacterium]|nr:cytochrome c biogenesis protein CcsA [Flavobacteriales bacterium]
VLSGIIFSKKSLFTLPATAFISGVILLVAWMNSMNPAMDPDITTLVPVLDSYWLMIHVELIIASYAFFFLSSFLGLLSLILMIFTKDNNKTKLRLLIDEFTVMNEQTINIGLFMLTIGTFLGGVWAAESWGRYWGWDSKEVWALISILVYAFVLHTRFIPGLKGKYIFNLMSVWSVYSIIMTFGE